MKRPETVLRKCRIVLNLIEEAAGDFKTPVELNRNFAIIIPMLVREIGEVVDKPTPKRS
jgi:hypothetical protein